MRTVLIAVVCDEQAAAILSRHPRFQVVYAAPNGTNRPAIDPPPTPGEGGTVQPSPLLLNLPEVANALRLSERKVRQLIVDGALPAVSVGRARRVRSADLAAFVERLGEPAKGAA